MKAVMYHYVRPDEPSLPYFRNLHIEDFKKQLDYFASNFEFLSQATLIESLRTGKPVPHSILLTFDDGLKDHYRYVFPELKRRNLYGIFYIPASPYLNGKLLDVHRIHLLIGKFGGSKVLEYCRGLLSEDMLTHAHIEEFRKLPYKNQSNDAATDQLKKILNYFISYDFREKIIDDLMRHFFPGKNQLVEQFYLSREEILEMNAAGMIIGSHGTHHRVMSKLSAKDQQAEIKTSFDFLESLLGPMKLKTFCYPYGGFYSFNKETEKLLEESGCAFSFNVESRDIESGDLTRRRQALPRYDCNEFPHGACRSAQQSLPSVEA